MITNREILFASLLGSKVAEAIPRFTNLQNELMKHVLPPIPFLPLKNDVGVGKPKTNSLTNSKNRERDESPISLEARQWRADFQLPENEQYFPLSLSFSPDGQRYLLPYEPFITVKGGNTIVKRNVAKAANLKGSVKERWNSSDHEITITGVLIGSIETGLYQDCYPIGDFKQLFDFLTKAKVIYVFSPMLLAMDIMRVVIQDYSFPFTKGENVQAYNINCTSDDKYNLLVPLSETESGVDFTERIPQSIANNNSIQG